MFILKRQDVEITSVQHPKRDQQIPILNYQGQTFRLINVFKAEQAEEARSFWRDLTDNRGKACVLLEEPDRYSVWGKIRLEQLASEESKDDHAVSPVLIHGCLLLLQAVYFDVEDLLGNRQAKSFHKDITNVFQQRKFPNTDSADGVQTLLTTDPLNNLQLPSWQEVHLYILLQELYRLGEGYFGNTSFAEGIGEIIEVMPAGDRTQFIDWLNQSPESQKWSVN
ncbi:MAG: Npun_F0813 family protein [Microcoleaceae cyanobacterium]